tara:strand:+ start:3758 stop:5116 length:1359 start_codon:yes stop_codon:yes gene_type:complete
MAWAPHFIPHEPHAKQEAFLALECLEAFYGGAGGGGKSDALLMAALQYVGAPGYHALLLRRTYPDLALPEAIMARSHEWLGRTRATWHAGDKAWSFPSGATLNFGYLQNENDKYRYDSAAFHFIGWDELTQFDESQYRFLFARLRRRKGAGETIPLRMRSASNPGGRGHEWVKRRMLEEGPARGRIFIPATLEDNPHLDASEYDRSLEELDPVTRAQRKRGDWTARHVGGYFQREWFEIVAEAPVGIQWVRFWDTASTEETPADASADPDWTAGALVGIVNGVYYLQDMRRVRRTPGGVEALVKQTAQLDRASIPGIRVVMEQEPGASGKGMIDWYRRHVLVGFNFRGKPSTGSKIERAGPVSSAAEAGNIKVVAGGKWISDFFDEAEGFPIGHDDQVDALSGAVGELARLDPKRQSKRHEPWNDRTARNARRQHPLRDPDDDRHWDKDEDT